MYLNKSLTKLICAVTALAIFNGCGSVTLSPPLSVHEQLKVDTEKAKGLLIEFEKNVQFIKVSNVEKYLTAVARQIAREDDVLKAEKVIVKIHKDLKNELKHSYSFPGLVISIPKSILVAINFENELAALIALELAQVERRELALELEKNENPILFGELSVFNFSEKSRGESIELGTKLMYSAGYDPRGMVALLQKYSGYFLDLSASNAQKEINFYIKQAQKAKNEFMPSLQPIVRSNDFLKMKKDLKGSS